LIRYLDHGLNNVQKRVDNRLQTASGGDKREEGYRSFGQAEKDIEGLVDVVWVSGSPNLQIPYLLRIGGMLSEMLPLFACAPKATFRILEKLDVAFLALLNGRDPETSEPLPGFEGGRVISTTDKVRLKGIVDRTRLIVVRRMGRGPVNEDGEPAETEDESMAESEGEGYVKFEGFENDDDDDEEESWEETQIGKVYERTIGELGDELRGPPIGIITDD
jgi:hypothetical protein